MANTYLWEVTNLEWTTANGGVYHADWRVGGSDGTFTATAFRSSNFEADPDSSDFVPLADVTEEMVLGWIPQGVKDAAQSSVDRSLEKQANPPSSEGLPWI